MVPTHTNKGECEHTQRLFFVDNLCALSADISRWAYSKGAEYMYFLVNQRMSPAVLTAIHHIQRVELLIGLLYMRGAWFKTDERQLHLFYGVK